MAAKLIAVDDHQIAFGLDWVPLSGDESEKQEVRSLVGDLDAAFEVRYANDHAIMLGFLATDDVPDGISKAEKTKLVSAAVLLATFPQITANAIWIEIEGQKARMAVLKDGLPLPSGDFYGDIGDADDRIRQIEADNGISFTFYGNYHAVYAESIPIALLELLHEGDVALATLKPASKSVNVKQIVLLTILLGVCGYIAISSLYTPQKHVQKAPPQDPNVAYQGALAAKLASAGVPVSAAIPALLGNWKIETLQGGWYLSKITCSADACAYTWTIQGGTFDSLQQAVGNEPYDFALDGKTATYAVPNAQVKHALLDRTKFPSFDAFKKREGSLAQDLGLLNVNLSFTPPQIFGVDQTSNINVAALRSPTRSGVVTGKGPVALLKDTLDRLPDSMTVEQVDMNTNGIDPQFTLQGTYYVKD